MKGWIHPSLRKLAAVLVFLVMPVAPIALLGGLVVTQTACPEQKSALSWAKRISRYATKASVIFTEEGQDAVKLNQLIGYADKLVAAIEAGDGSAAGYAASAIKLMDELEPLARKIESQSKRILALVALGFIDEALHEIADGLPNAVVTSRSVGSPDAATLQTFKAKKRWRCRDSKSGQFRKMSFCESNPDTSTVETF